MTDSPMMIGHDALEEKLARLATKPGVRASIVLDRASGAIIKTSGELSVLRTAKARDEATAASFSNEAPAAEARESQGVEDFAVMIWNYVNSSAQLVQDMDKEDALRLLRLRTKKQEIVIVPDAKYVLTVIHEPPSS
ncbi:hypothetical protein E4U53_003697 [Claviceps sorghi]|nr:hypothetical protein E4U53_003697 [Claviceps sorghi]